MSQHNNYKGNIFYLVYPVYCLSTLGDPVDKGGGGGTSKVLLGLPNEVRDGDDARHGGVVCVVVLLYVVQPTLSHSILHCRQSRHH